MSIKPKKRLLRIGALMSAISVLCPRSNAASQTDIIYVNKKKSNSNGHTAAGIGAFLFLTAAGLAANEYLGMQGFSFCKPIYFNKGINSLTSDGLSKNRINEPSNEAARVLEFFGKESDLCKFSDDNKKTILGDNENNENNENLEKYKVDFMNARKNNSLCVILRNKEISKSYIGAPGRWPKEHIKNIWKKLRQSQNNVDIKASAINDNMENIIFDEIKDLKSSFGLEKFGKAGIEFNFFAYGNQENQENNTKKNGILEIKLTFEKTNGNGETVSLSFFSPCEEKNNIDVAENDNFNEDEKDEDLKPKNDKNSGGKGFFQWFWPKKN